MSEHYYTKQPTTATNIKLFSTTLRGRTFQFSTDAGVFSRQEIDYGSRLLIETMNFADSAQVLDVGCGYGPVGIVAASIACHGMTTLIDLNERAVQLARENAQRNQIHNVRIMQSDLFNALAAETFDTIVTNPPIRAGKAIVHRIFVDSFAHLRLGGSLWVVIQKKQGAPSAYEKLQSIFGNVNEVHKDKGYRIFEAIKQK
jgi:16S rRNA (guanine1207-N2)-methyltransferase